MSKKKTTAKVAVTGQSVIYLQPIKKGKKKLGKAVPYLATTVRATGTVSPAKKTRRKRK
jgi:hypothetical protein